MEFRPIEDFSDFYSERPKRSISQKKRKKVFENDGNKCVECGTGKNLTIDHIIPVSKGGGDEYHNLQTMCQRCNNKKGNKITNV